MKGPGFRIDLDVRRVWRCPRCGRLARTAGGITAQRCHCAEDGTWMQLQPPVKREPFRPPPRSPEDRAADDAEDARLADESQELATNISGDNGDAPPVSASPTAETAVEAGDARSDSAAVNLSLEGDRAPPEAATPAVERVAEPTPSADGFGAGVVEAAPPDPSTGDSSPPTG